MTIGEQENEQYLSINDISTNFISVNIELSILLDIPTII